MVLYIAHSSSRHNDQAARAKSGLATPSRDTKVLCSMDFDGRGNARKNNGYPTWDTCFRDATALIVLMPPPKDAPGTDFSLGVQLGAYIEICRYKQRPPRIFCLHHPNVDVSDITVLCAPEVITVVRGEAPAVKDFVLQLYPEETRDSIFETTTTLLLAAVEAQVPTERHTTAATCTVTVVEGDLAKLSAGEIPPDAAIGGDRWEEWFGAEAAQSGLTWREVRKKVANPDQWEPILAEELEAVRIHHQQHNAVPILLDEATNIPPASAVVQKYEVYPGNFPDGQGKPHSKLPSVHRFSLVTFRAPMLYDPGDPRPVATAFHLVVVAQLYRFKVLEEDFNNLSKAIAMLVHKERIPDASTKASKAIADLRRHLLLIDVESRRRDFLNRLASFNRLILDSLPPGADDAKKAAAAGKQKRLSDIFNAEWNPVRERLDSAIRAGEAGLSDIVASLEEMKKLNAEVLAITASAYAGLVDIEYPTA